jgi:hypothetical protein
VPPDGGNALSGAKRRTQKPSGARAKDHIARRAEGRKDRGDRKKSKGGRGKKRNLFPEGTGLTDPRKQAADWQKLGAVKP